MAQVNPIYTFAYRLVNAKNARTALEPENPDGGNSYVCIGRVNPWENESNPPAITHSLKATEFDVWRHMASAKKITNVKHVIRRIDWASGTEYARYDVDTEYLNTKDFYVVISTRDVFKCINNGGDGESTVEPTKPSDENLDELIETSDGYAWVYMYTISSSDMEDFSTDSYIPINDTNDIDRVSGRVDFIDVASAGSGYGTQFIENSTISSYNSSTRTVVSSDLTLSPTDDIFEGCVFEADGEYSEITSYSTTNTERTFVLAENISISSGNSFSIYPKVKITATDARLSSNTNAQAYATVNDSGEIDKIVIYEKGSGYTFYTAKVDISSDAASAGANGSGAVLRPIISPTGGHGSDYYAELYGNQLMIKVTFEGGLESGGRSVFTENDFRQISILQNPLIQDSSTLATGNIIKQTASVSLTNVSSTNNVSLFQSDDVITNSDGSTARIVESSITGTSAELEILSPEHAFSATDTVTITRTSPAGTVTGTVSEIEFGDLEPFSGNVIYINNREAIARNVNQIEDHRIVLTF